MRLQTWKKQHNICRLFKGFMEHSWKYSWSVHGGTHGKAPWRTHGKVSWNFHGNASWNFVELWNSYQNRHCYYDVGCVQAAHDVRHNSGRSSTVLLLGYWYDHPTEYISVTCVDGQFVEQDLNEGLTIVRTCQMEIQPFHLCSPTHTRVYFWMKSPKMHNWSRNESFIQPDEPKTCTYIDSDHRFKFIVILLLLKF